jgi:succinate-semialdehyde dehydrogenase/glutarate-semialdehyde dehydrogenase/succinyl-CoA reductase
MVGTQHKGKLNISCYISNVNVPLIHCINPATEEEIFSYEPSSKNDVNRAAVKARKAFQQWKRLSAEKRADKLFEAARIIGKKKNEFSKLITTEMGKPIKESIAEVKKCAWGLRYFAENGPKFLEDEGCKTDAKRSYISFESLGVIGCIMPWNFPMWQPMRSAAPSLMAGNTVVLKPSRYVPRSGMMLEEIFADALPEGCFNTVVGDSVTGNALLDADLDGFSFTGSVDAGIEVGLKAASRVKKFVLELGGSDPFVVLEDADVERAAEYAVIGRFVNCGQSCIASKRFIVVKRVFDDFVDHFISNTKKLKVGDPLKRDTDLGPLASKDALSKIESQVGDAKRKGATILAGGKRTGKKGYFYAPTIIADVNNRMRVVSEEVFGPVAPIIVAKDGRDAVQKANSTRFGLGASLWTSNIGKARKIARRIEAGLVTINSVAVSDPRMPFGGIKQSGIGRELSRYGMLEFVNIKSVRLHK